MGISRSNAEWVIGVDVGGTFTDFYALERLSGLVHVHKVPTTPDNPARAILAGLRQLEAAKAVPLASVARLAHGTTVATNALIQRQGGSVGVITTRGFRDLLEIGRQTRPKIYDLRTDFPKPLARREHRLEVTERIGPDGEVLVPLAEAELAGLATALREAAVESCAVCLLFSYINPEHERRIGAYLRTHLSGVAVSLSSDVHPEFREYERFSTTVLNAYLQPTLSGYIDDLRTELVRLVPIARFGINQSNGGLMSPERTCAFPIRTALSGPAAGAVGAGFAARLSGRAEIITFDMGGTSTDVSLIRNFEPTLSFSRDVAGFPIRLPMLDINSVGAGGGSIAWFDKDGLLKVGPLSAGAEPGPACYGRGGEHATVTDANVVLGRLSGRGLLGGAMSLDTRAAEKAVERIAERLGFDVHRAARGILDIVVANMVRVIRAISIGRGHDPRGFTLLAFGGAGPLMASAVARSLEIPEVMVPVSPGILCAQGLIVADLKEHFVRSRRLTVEGANMAVLQSILGELVAEAHAWFEVESALSGERRIEVSLDMRHVGQNFEIQVPMRMRQGDYVLPDASALRAEFLSAHESTYGFSNNDDPVEVINVRITARGVPPLPSKPRAPSGAVKSPSPIERRPVWFERDRPVETPVYARDSVAVGARMAGPAIIEQFDSTTVLYPGDVARVDPARNLLIEVAK